MPNLCGTAVPNMVDILQTWRAGGLPVKYLLKGRWDDVMYVGFDPKFIADEADPARGYIDIQFKNFPVKLENAYVNGCCQVQWTEKNITQFAKTKFKGDVTASTTITISTKIDSLADLRGLSVGSQVIITSHTTGLRQLAFVTALSGTTITLDTAITAVIGDSLIRGPKYRVIGDCTTIVDDEWTRRGEKSLVSNPASIPVSIKFNLCDLNKDRQMYYHGKTVDDYIAVELAETVEGFHQVFSLALLFGKNIPATGGAPSQTMGIYESIIDAQFCVNPSLDAAKPYYVHDFADCCDEAETDCDILAEFERQVLRQLRRSAQYAGGKDIVAWVNQAMLDQIYAMEDAIAEKFGGPGLIMRNVARNELDGWVYNRTEWQSFQYAGSRFIFMDSQVVEETWPDTPTMIIFPRDNVGFYQFAVEGMNEDMKVQVGQERMPRVELHDASPYIAGLTGAKECFVYRGNFRFFIVLYGLQTGAFQIVHNLYAKVNCNPESCSTSMYTDVDKVECTVDCNGTPTTA